MKRTERAIGFFNVKIIAKADGLAAPLPMTAAAAFGLIAALPNKTLKRKGAKQTSFISASELVETEYRFILNRTDKDIAPPIFNDIDKAVRREVDKDEGEGHEFSAHCRVKFNQANPKAPALLFMEMTTGFSPLKVATIFRRLLRRAKTTNPAAFKQPHPNGAVGADNKPIMVDVSFEFQVEGHISRQVADDLANGVISSIELIDDSEFVQGFDQEGYFKETKKVVTIGVRDDAPPWGDKLEKLKEIFAAKRDRYGKAVVVFKKNNGKKQSLRWDKDDGFDLQYVRKELVTGLVPPMKSTYIEFHEDLMNRMKMLVA